MFGIILFWISYIFAAILLYTILRCSYTYELVNEGYRNTYKKTDIRKKRPLWLILLLLIILFIPMLNMLVFSVFMIISTGLEYEDRVYYKSF